jgi:FMN phosphatase YigB (HAD superfamily)
MKAQEQSKPVIVLDVGKVLVDIDPTVVLGELSTRYGRKIDPHLRPNLDRLFFPLYVGIRSWDDTIEDINSALGLSLDAAEWRDLWCRVLKGEVSGMREVLTELKREFLLVALSNTDEIHWDYALRNYQIFELLDGSVVSYREGVTKPDPDIYQAVVQRYCAGKLPFFYTDDMPTYVEAARQLGWDAEVFHDAARFRYDTEKRRGSYLGGGR